MLRPLRGRWGFGDGLPGVGQEARAGLDPSEDLFTESFANTKRGVTIVAVWANPLSRSDI
jgi:hypothetical protein